MKRIVVQGIDLLSTLLLALVGKRRGIGLDSNEIAVVEDRASVNASSIRVALPTIGRWRDSLMPDGIP